MKLPSLKKIFEASVVLAKPAMASSNKKVMIYVFPSRVAIADNGQQIPAECDDTGRAVVQKGKPKFWVGFDDSVSGEHRNDLGYVGPFVNENEARNQGINHASKNGLQVVSYEESEYGEKHG